MSFEHNFSPRVLDEIRMRLPISRVVGERVKFDVKKSNASRGDYWACCPFHSEKTPSFHCDDRRGFYHCFGCGEKGDHFAFLMRLKGMHFPEAVEYLAQQAGVILPRKNAVQVEQEKRQQDLYKIMDLACKFYEEQLFSVQGAEAYAYLEGRGLGLDIIRKFRLGYALNDRTALKDYLLQKHVTISELEACGLIISGEDIRLPYDRFRNRIMFPILDFKGRVVAFGGRAMDPEARAKYLNSPQTELFHKGSMLYNLGEARKALLNGDKKDRLIVVEGYMDVIALDRDGIHTAIAPLGTALTEDQLRLIWRYCPQPVLCFDGDDAGRSAAYRAIDRALEFLHSENGLFFSILPKGKDPDDILRLEGVDAMRGYLENKRPLLDMLWERETAGKNFHTPEERAYLEKNLKSLVYRIKDKTLRYYYGKEIRTRLLDFFRPAYPKRQYPKKNKGIAKGQAFTPEIDMSMRRDVIPLREAVILTILMQKPQLWDVNFESLSRLEFTHKVTELIYQTMLDILAEDIIDEKKNMRMLLLERLPASMIEMLEEIPKNTGIKICAHDYPCEEAQLVLNQAVQLYLRSSYLKKKLLEIEQEILNNPVEETFLHMKEIKQELFDIENMKPLQEK